MKSLREYARTHKTEAKSSRIERPRFDPDFYLPPDTSIDPSTFTLGVTLALILIAMLAIGAGLGEGLLAFSPSDVDYLFPSPISRRTVLAYRLPALTLGALGMALYFLLILGMVNTVGEVNLPDQGHSDSPWWVNPVALFLSGGTYLNLAMFLAIRVKNRSAIRKAVNGAMLVLAGSVGALGWFIGVPAIEPLVQSPVIRWLFLPSTLTADSLLDGYAHRPAAGPLLWLFLGYVLSLVPMLATNANWYEQSIVISERMAALRQAAKGGFSAVMAARASTKFKHKGDKPYTLPPFGQGAMALLWAHLCAAWKKPLANFAVPLAAGVVLAVISVGMLQPAHGSGEKFAIARQMHEGIGYGTLGFMAFYGSTVFLATSRGAVEAAIGRRDLVFPLPIRGWQIVAADMGVPFVAAFLCFGGCALTYALLHGPNWPIVAFGFAIAMPLRVASRIVLQYIVVIAYPDLADKIQSLLSTFVYCIVAIPFVALEAILAVPAIFLHSAWAALIPVTLLQIPLLALFLFLAGKGSERALASGEPITLIRLMTGRA